MQLENRVAIITGAGRAFCAGRDLKERAADNAAGVQARAADSMGADSLAWFEHTWDRAPFGSVNSRDRAPNQGTTPLVEL